jgi:hypothetical protein
MKSRGGTGSTDQMAHGAPLRAASRKEVTVRPQLFYNPENKLELAWVPKINVQPLVRWLGVLGCNHTCSPLVCRSAPSPGFGNI